MSSTQLDPTPYVLAETTITIIRCMISDIRNYVKEAFNKRDLELKEQTEEEELYNKLFECVKIYHSKTLQKLKYIKTFLNVNTVPFTDIYYPLSVKLYSDTDYNRESVPIRIDENIEELFENNPHIILLGTAGSGKTMITKRLFLSALEHKRLIPIIIEFRKIDKELSIYDYIKKFILNFDNYIINEKIFDSIVESGHFLFIFDGYDEIVYRNGDFRFTDLEKFINRFYNNSFVVTSRFGNNAENLGDFETYTICGLELNDINPFIYKQCKQIKNGDQIYYKIAKKIDNQLLYEKYEINKDNVLVYTNDYYDYLKIPLLLTLFIKTFNHFKDLPKNKCIFYDRIFETLWYDHERQPRPVLPNIETPIHVKAYEKDVYEKIINNFAFKTLYENIVLFDRIELINWLKQTIDDLKYECNTEIVFYDLVSSISVIIQDGGIYSFPHKSLQEYFAAKCIQKLNQEDKILFFNQLLDPTKFSGYDNFLTILYEIDKYNFCKYFLIKKIEEIDECCNHHTLSLLEFACKKWIKDEDTEVLHLLKHYNYIINLLAEITEKNERKIDYSNLIYMSYNQSFYELINKGRRIVTSYISEQEKKLKLSFI